MTIDTQQATLALRDIAATERRTAEALFNARSAAILALWGVITAIGYVLEFVFPLHSALAWMVLDGAGGIATALMLRQRKVLGSRLGFALLSLVVFGLVLVTVVGPLPQRQMNAFWPLLFMLGYVLAGLWVGRFFILCGVSVAALTVAGYFWSGPWFALWMAAVNGGGLILGGWWLRRTGAWL